MASNDEKIANLQAITGADTDKARDYLQAYDWDMQAAAQALLEDVDEGDDSDQEEAQGQVPDNYTGPRTLDGRPVATGSGSQPRGQPKRQEKKRGVATLSSLGSSRHAHGSEDDDDEDDEDEKGRGDLFAGGEKSGLALRDPSQRPERGEGSRGIINDILAKAREQARKGADEEAEQQPTRRWGSGNTLGGDGVESRRVGDSASGAGTSQAAAPPVGEAQDRTIHIWHDGFSFDDGPLYRYDDPENQETLRLIRSGRAPLHLMNVRFDQPVNAHISQHDEPWKQLPKIYRPFGGEGRRLGSPVPGDGNAVRAVPATSQPTSAIATTSSSSSGPPGTGVDSSQPTVALRVQLPDGTRLPARFNTTQTVGDIYSFVTRAHPATQDRPFVVATTFPNKDHTDHSLVLGELPEFKKGGTAVIKWV